MAITEDSVTLNQEQEALRQLMETSKQHLFITGKAGTGKSTLLQEFKKQTKKQVAIVAPTGVAALNIGGQTIHSLFRIKPSDVIDFEQLRTNKATKNVLEKIETLVIDEVSMVRADIMDAIDHILKFCNRSSEPFGGVQVIMFGDLFQLPPVIRGNELEEYFENNYGGYYFFNAKVWQEAELETHELQTNIRQENDEDFVAILNTIRNKHLDTNLMLKLNERMHHKPQDKSFITLALTNKTVSEINERELRSLPGQEFIYTADIDGALLESEYPTNKHLKLKVGAQVMFLRNDKDKRYVNGSIGTVTYLSAKEIHVDLDGELIALSREHWDKIRYSIDPETQSLQEEKISSFTQFPLKLAWAITVHKSQGQTLDNVVLDMGYGAFAHGQTYVALSRCRSLGGLYLKRAIRDRDVIIDDKVLSFLS